MLESWKEALFMNLTCFSFHGSWKSLPFAAKLTRAKLKKLPLAASWRRSRWWKLQKHKVRTKNKKIHQNIPMAGLRCLPFLIGIIEGRGQEMWMFWMKKKEDRLPGVMALRCFLAQPQKTRCPFSRQARPVDRSWTRVPALHSSSQAHLQVMPSHTVVTAVGHLSYLILEHFKTNRHVTARGNW